MPYDHHLKQPNDGGTFPPSRFLTYCLHCKNAANSAPPNLMCTSHSEPRRTEKTRTIAIKIVMTSNGFCDIALYSLSERHYPSTCLRVVRQASVNVMFPGPSSFWPLANLRPASKAPAHTLPFYPSCSKPRIAIARLFLFPAGIFYFPACIVTKSNYL